MGYNAPTNTYDTFADLRQAIGQSSSSVTVLGRSNSFDGLGGTFAFYSAAIEADDDFSVIQPLNQSHGRWLRVTTGMPLSGTAVFNGNGSTVTFGITFPSIILPFDDYQLALTPLTPDSFGPWEISKSDSGFFVHFNTAPPTGTNNVQFDYFVRHKYTFL